LVIIGYIFEKLLFRIYQLEVCIITSRILLLGNKKQALVQPEGYPMPVYSQSKSEKLFG